MGRQMQKSIKIFLEGDTELHYFKGLKCTKHLSLKTKEINLKGGGYTSVLKTIRKEGEYGYIAIFIIIDFDRYKMHPGEKEPFMKLVEYCRVKNKIKNGIPYFLIVNNDDFEYFACLHCPHYKNQDTNTYIISKLGYKCVDDFKADVNIFTCLNQGKNNYGNAMTLLRHKTPYLRNVFEYKEKGLDVNIKIKTTLLDDTKIPCKCSNIHELFDVLGL